MRTYFDWYVANRLRIESRDLLALGRLQPNDANERSALIPSDRSPQEFTPRIIASYPDTIVPLEANEIIWFK